MTGAQLVTMLNTYGVDALANDNLYDQINQLIDQCPVINEATISHIMDPEKEVVRACEQLLDALVIDWRRDHNTKETPERMARMFVREVFKGRYKPKPELKDFPNVKELDQIYTVGPVTVRSCCSHHFVPIMGQCWMGILPHAADGRVLGLSKFARLADWVFSRPQIQEEATEQIADIVSKAVEPRGLAIVVRATHMCMTWRGVKETETSMVTSSMRGTFKEDGTARAEFFNLIKGQGF